MGLLGQAWHITQVKAGKGSFFNALCIHFLTYITYIILHYCYITKIIQIYHTYILHLTWTAYIAFHGTNKPASNWRPFSKTCVFGAHKRRLHMDRRLKRRSKSSFSKISGYVWTGPSKKLHYIWGPFPFFTWYVWTRPMFLIRGNTYLSHTLSKTLI